MKNIIALQGKPVRPFTKEERAVYDVLLECKKDGGGGYSALGLTRKIKNNRKLAKADKKIAAAAESLWAGMYICKYENDSYGIE